MTTKLRAVSSADLFNKYVDQAKQPSSHFGKEISRAEVKAALDTFSWGDQKVTKAEVKLAKETLTGLEPTMPAWNELQNFIIQSHGGETGGFSYERQADTFRAVESSSRWDSLSQEGNKFTAAEATTLLSIFGDNPAPARVAQVARTKADAAASTSKLPSSTAKVLDAWLKEHALSKPEGKLGTDLAAATKNVQWPSESPRAIYPLELDAPAGKLTASKARILFNEPTSTPVKLSKLDDVFANKPDAKLQKLHAQLATLTDVQVIAVGAGYEKDLYILGRAPNGKLAGIVTSTVGE